MLHYRLNTGSLRLALGTEQQKVSAMAELKLDGQAGLPVVLAETVNAPRIVRFSSIALFAVTTQRCIQPPDSLPCCPRSTA